MDGWHDQDLLFYKMWDGYWQRYRIILVGTRKVLGGSTYVDGECCAVYTCTNPAFKRAGSEIVVTWKNAFKEGGDSGYVSYLVRVRDTPYVESYQDLARKQRNPMTKLFIRIKGLLGL